MNEVEIMGVQVGNEVIVTSEEKAMVKHEVQLATNETTADLAILTPQNLKMLSEQRKLFLDFVKSQMISGVDYGRFGQARKDTLLKPGAEKLLRLFGLGFRISKEEDRFEDSFILCSRKIEVYSLRTGRILSECQGSANSTEPQYKGRQALSILNTLQKMAQKRALVGAVLSATGSSEIFTQDMEDEVIHEQNDPLKEARDNVYKVANEKQLPNDFISTVIKQRYHKESSLKLSLSELKDLAAFIKESCNKL